MSDERKSNYPPKLLYLFNFKHPRSTAQLSLSFIITVVVDVSVLDLAVV